MITFNFEHEGTVNSLWYRGRDVYVLVSRGIQNTIACASRLTYPSLVEDESIKLGLGKHIEGAARTVRIIYVNITRTLWLYSLATAFIMQGRPLSPGGARRE